ncbi:hypothetical protein [Corallococcus sicarius]|uniref:hypothetical protein n=1 Tax=Corallococcus sicarius TaxID=2316726 RepID=UPI0011C486F4|nr:hypothetical protein [Corallococcus sicarius]
MTLVAAWVRRTGTPEEELVVASDSRLSGGLTWDQGPKLFPLARGDCVLAFAGDTAFAYPVVLQILLYLQDFEGASTRRLPLEELISHLEKLVTHLLRDVRELPAGSQLKEEFHLLVAGRSVLTRAWRTWISRFDAKKQTFHLVKPGRQHTSVGATLIGDGAVEARKLLGSQLRPQRGRPLHLGWEPFDVLRDMIRSQKHRTVGGPIQLVAVQQRLATMSFAVMWPQWKKGKLTLLGRELLEYERTQRLAFDPDNHEVLLTWDYLDEPEPLSTKRKRLKDEGIDPREP